MKSLSKAEEALMKSVGGEYLFEPLERGSLMAPRAWEMVAMQVFEDNIQDKRADAIRKIIKALRTCSPFRMTPEFDSLCEF